MAIALSVLASTTHATTPRIDFAPKRALEAGEVVTVRWSGLPQDVDELEFLLQRDDGTFVRLTEQLSPTHDSFRWTVPALPSRRAKLVLRAGIEGREMTLATSEPFVIDSAMSGARLRFRDGEWWSSDVRPPAPDAPQISFVPEGEAAQTLACAPRPLLLITHLDLGGAQPLEALAPTSLAANTRCGPPRTIPQRK